jgi:hypothetical protein
MEQGKAPELQKKASISQGSFVRRLPCGYANSRKSTGTTREIPFSTIVMP